MIQYSAKSANIGIYREIIDKLYADLQEQQQWPGTLVNPVYVFLLAPKTQANIVLSPHINNVGTIALFLQQVGRQVYGVEDFSVVVDFQQKYNKQGRWVGLRATKNKNLIETYCAICLLVLGLENNLILQPQGAQ